VLKILKLRDRRRELRGGCHQIMSGSILMALDQSQKPGRRRACGPIRGRSRAESQKADDEQRTKPQYSGRDNSADDLQCRVPTLPGRRLNYCFHISSIECPECFRRSIN